MSWNAASVVSYRPVLPPTSEGSRPAAAVSAARCVFTSPSGIWTNSTVLSGEVVTEITKLKREQDGDIVVHGSAQLVQSLIDNDLVDELRLMVFPVVLGTGKRLFAET